MVGIKDISVYLPYYYLNREVIGSAWGDRGGAGEKRVANYDEDSVTMAIEAGFRCLEQSERNHIKGLYFASTTAPYWEKQSASICARVLDFPSDIRTIDFSGSIRSGTDAVLSGMDAVLAGKGDVLVVSADKRPAIPRSNMESTFGDGAAALLIGNSKVICEYIDSLSIWDDITDVWRRDKDEFVKTWEDRFTIQMGYEKNMERSIKTLLESNNLTAENIDKVVLYGPDSRSRKRLTKKLGFKPKQVHDSLLDKIGNTGSPHALIELAAALSEAKPAEKILWASFGSGSDVFLFEVTDEIERRNISLRKALPLDVGEELSYQRYLAFRGFVQTPQELVRLFPSASVMWRTSNWASSMHGSKCNKCGTIVFPVQRVCYSCKAKDDFEEVRLSDRKGKIFTYSLDNLAGGLNPPTVQTIVEFEGGARIYCLMTDCNPRDIKIGMPVTMTFRLFHEEGGFYNYYWKCRPFYGGQA